MLTLAAATMLAAAPIAGSGFGDASAQTSSVLARYDFEAAPAFRWKLPRALDEISGLATDSSGRLFAHDDERAIIYELDPAARRIVKRFAFGRPAVRGDFEGIAVVDDRVFLTTSDGVVYAGREGRDGESVSFASHATGIGRRCEVEGLSWDEGAQSLRFACKVPRAEGLRGQLAVFEWSPVGIRPSDAPSISIPLAPIVQRVGHSAVYPSELLRDPSTGHLLLLAARARAIIEITAAGAVVDVARLRAGLHRQAEGLAFGRDGTLLVSDEADGARATLTGYRPVR
ncbi:MAG: SdiA-regulated domain-containing protein [Gemmatimonadales bacterium]